MKIEFSGDGRPERLNLGFKGPHLNPYHRVSSMPQ